MAKGTTHQNRTTKKVYQYVVEYHLLSEIRLLHTTFREVSLLSFSGGWFSL